MSSSINITPSNEGEACLGNGETADTYGNLIECHCEECDFYLQCFPNWQSFSAKTQW
jgi:hypothetical protein